MTLIRCPFPPTEQRPNFIRSNHWSKWRKIGKTYEADCWGLALLQNVHKQRWPDGDIKLEYTFYRPKGCRWDRDNIEGAFKKGQDGIALAMGIDDARFDVTKKHEKSDSDGCVLVRILTPTASEVELVGQVT